MPHPLRRLWPLLTLAAAALACSDSSQGPPAPAFRSATASPNPRNTISAVVTVDATGYDSAFVRYWRGLEEVAESGVMIHGDVSAELLRTIFSPKTPLHDGAVIIRGEAILAAAALLPLAETTVHAERFGTRHRAALGIAEQTDAVVVVVSEENGQISLVERSRIVRNLNEGQLARTIRHLLDPSHGRRRGAFGWRSAPAEGTSTSAARAPR